MWVIEIPGQEEGEWEIVRRGLSPEEAEELRQVNIADGQIDEVDFRIRDLDR